MSTARPIVIRALAAADAPGALAVINTAARWYREFLPPEHRHEPEMTPRGWEAECGRMTWYGAFVDEHLVAVAALEYAGDAALLRHAYVLPGSQRAGIGSALTRHLEGEVRGARRIVVGTYAANYKARGALERLGYRLVPDSAAVLRAYYDIPEDRLAASVAYAKERGG